MAIKKGSKRVKLSSVKKWAIGTGSVAIGALFTYLLFLGAITITSYSSDMVCAGTLEDPCLANISFIANTDIFIYPDSEWMFDVNPLVKELRLYRTWGSGWREIDLTTNCKGTWCGAKDNSGNTKYSYAFREGREYTVQIRALKFNPNDVIKWGFGFDTVGVLDSLERDYVDPVWNSVGYPEVRKKCKFRTVDDSFRLPTFERVCKWNKTIKDASCGRVQNGTKLVRRSRQEKVSCASTLDLKTRNISLRDVKFACSVSGVGNVVCDSTLDGNGDGVCDENGGETCAFYNRTSSSWKYKNSALKYGVGRPVGRIV